jgi:hypothetical protein
MGFNQAIKVSALIESAERARDQGRKIFVARLADVPSDVGPAASLPTMGETIETIESKGWIVDMITAGHEADGGRTVLVVMFRLIEPIDYGGEFI